MPAGQTDYALAAYSISSYIHTHTTTRKSERKTGDVHNSTNNKQKQRIGADFSLFSMTANPSSPVSYCFPVANT